VFNRGYSVDIQSSPLRTRACIYIVSSMKQSGNNTAPYFCTVERILAALISLTSPLSAQNFNSENAPIKRELSAFSRMGVTERQHDVNKRRRPLSHEPTTKLKALSSEEAITDYFKGDRSPAVLTRDSEQVTSALKSRQFSVFGREEMEEKTGNTREETLSFEEAFSELLNRMAPYSYRDYADFRDFISSSTSRIETLDLSATDFKTKAESIFKEFYYRDQNPQHDEEKSRFRDYIEDRPSAPQPISISDSSPRSRQFPQIERPTSAPGLH
jgi:hypothetical protein